MDDACCSKTLINVRQSITAHKTHEDFESISNADALVIAFPLYIFCMPGILTRFFEDYYKYYVENKNSSKSPRVYAIVNCGFPEPGINLEAVNVIKSFCRHINANFRFGIMLGGGPMLLGAKDAPFMKKAMSSLNNEFSAIANDIMNGSMEERDNAAISSNTPGRIYHFMGNLGWVSSARKNGLKKKDLYKKPYC
jgi:multimeric flavodoxin WrbA